MGGQSPPEILKQVARDLRQPPETFRQRTGRAEPGFALNAPAGPVSVG